MMGWQEQESFEHLDETGVSFYWEHPTHMVCDKSRLQGGGWGCRTGIKEKKKSDKDLGCPSYAR